MKNLKHLTNIHEAAHELHKRLLGSPWYIRIQVMTQPPASGPVSNKEEKKEIVVFVRDESQASGPTTFNSWPVRYEVSV